jgi:hypothetical protein
VLRELHARTARAHRQAPHPPPHMAEGGEGARTHP